MKKIIKGMSAALIVVSLALGMASCGGSSPTAAAKAFMAAVEKNDTKAMEKVATKQTIALMATFGEKAAESMKKYGKITGTTEKIDGDNATVSFTFENGETQEVTLVKENGKWLVDVNK